MSCVQRPSSTTTTKNGIARATRGGTQKMATRVKRSKDGDTAQAAVEAASEVEQGDHSAAEEAAKRVEQQLHGSYEQIQAETLAEIDAWVNDTTELFGQYAAAFVSSRELAEQILVALEKANDYYLAAGHPTPQALIMEKFAGALAKLSKTEQDEVMRWLRGGALSQAAVGAIFGVSTKTIVGREARARERADAAERREVDRLLAEQADNVPPGRINENYGYNEPDELGPEDPTERALREAREAMDAAVGAAPNAQETEELKTSLRSWVANPRLTTVRRKAMIRFMRTMLEQLERDVSS